MSVSVEYHRVFVKKFKKLPLNIKNKAVFLEKIFRENPFAPILRTKPLKGQLSQLYSFRVTREYRIVFGFTAYQQVVFYNVGHRKDIYEN